jgi:hypothetical protein
MVDKKNKKCKGKKKDVKVFGPEFRPATFTDASARGNLAIGWLKIKRAQIEQLAVKRLKVEELEIGRITVREGWPEKPA